MQASCAGRIFSVSSSLAKILVMSWRTWPTVSSARATLAGSSQVKELRSSRASPMRVPMSLVASGHGSASQPQFQGFMVNNRAFEFLILVQPHPLASWP